MGWKNVKDHYRIGHSVQVTGAGICIGSPYVHDIIVISIEGEIVKPSAYHSEDLDRYMDEFKADPQKLKELVQSPDRFANNVTVWTYDGGDIVEKQCESPGWPNCTHDGLMMYDNTFSLDRDQVVKWAISNAQAGVELARDRVNDAETRLNEAKAMVAQFNADLVKLSSEPRP